VRRALHLPPYAALAVLSGAGAAELAGGLERLRTSPAGAGRGGGGGADGEVSSGGGKAGPVEVNALGDGRWAVRAPDHAALADALAAVERPGERVRVEVGPVRL
jgi:hypothetical protein